jgi:glyoxylase-like metal-dependent hydrolase (beta-lactamase superfamily II)
MKGPVEIVPGVYGLGDEMVNWYVVEDGGRLTAVDAGIPAYAKTLESDLRSIGRAPADVEALVLTHSDADHTGIAPQLREAGARVLIHSADDATLRKPGPKKGDASPRHLLKYLRRPQVWRLMVHLTRGGAARPPKVEGAETFEDAALLDAPGSPRVVHTPGHTPGHCALLFDSQGVLFVGDALCTWNPVTGSRGPQRFPSAMNESNVQALESLGRIEGLDAQVVLPGHGEPYREGPRAAVAAARAAGIV